MIRLLTLSALAAFAAACGGGSDDSKRSDSGTQGNQPASAVSADGFDGRYAMFVGINDPKCNGGAPLQFANVVVQIGNGDICEAFATQVIPAGMKWINITVMDKSSTDATIGPGTYPIGAAMVNEDAPSAVGYSEHDSAGSWTGTITLDSLSADTVTGSLDAQDSQGVSYTGAFTALFCKPMEELAFSQCGS